MTYVIEHKAHKLERWYETFRSASESEARIELWRLMTANTESRRIYRVREVSA